jgi:hypothetical protein
MLDKIFIHNPLLKNYPKSFRKVEIHKLNGVNMIFACLQLICNMVIEPEASILPERASTVPERASTVPERASIVPEPASIVLPR